MKKIFGMLLGLVVCSSTEAFAANCNDVPTASQLRAAMLASAGTTAGGLFNGDRMWGAVVNRDGEVCAYITTTADATQVWPGSQAIAKAKAYTANAFSVDILPLSTAMLYTFTQPGHSLWSLGQSNLWNPNLTASPGGQAGGNNQIAGGLIFFGGGVPIYKGNKIVGGLGISGDTSCTDHEIAKRARNQLGLNPPGGANADDIQYGSSVFAHPKCLNTYQNGVFVGDESPAGPY